MTSTIRVDRSIYGQVLAPNDNPVVQYLELDWIRVQDRPESRKALALNSGIISKVKGLAYRTTRLTEPIRDNLSCMFLERLPNFVGRHVIVSRIVKERVEEIVSFRSTAARELSDNIPRRIIQYVEAIGAPNARDIN
jgi:hypothetical protein